MKPKTLTALVSLFTLSMLLGAYSVITAEREIEPEHSGTTKDNPLANIAAVPTKSSSEKTNFESQALLLATIAELKQEIRDMKTNMAAINIQDNTMLDDATKKQSEELQKAQQADEEHLYFQKIGNQFTEQPIDVSWSTEATKRIENALFNQASEDLNIDHIECRSSICKLEINDMTEKSMEIFKNEFRNQIADVFNAGMAGQDESGKTVIYMAKEFEDFTENN
jgi:hypothetical protein